MPTLRPLSPIRRRRPFFIGGTAMSNWPNYAMRLQMLAVADFLSMRSPSSVVFDAEFTPIADDGPIARVTLFSLGLGAKATTTLPTIICSPLEDTAKINTHKVRPCHVNTTETCGLCSRRLLRSAYRPRNVLLDRDDERRIRVTGNIAATDCGGLFHASCLEAYRESVLGNICPHCPSTERMRTLMDFSADRSFIKHSSFEMWLESRLPIDFTTITEVPSLCCVCVKRIEGGIVSQPYSCECFAHYECTMRGIRENDDALQVIQCNKCTVLTRRVRLPGGIYMTARSGSLEESELHQDEDA